MDTARTIPSSWVQEALEAPCPLGKLFVTAPGSAFSRTSPPPPPDLSSTSLPTEPARVGPGQV